MRYEDDVIEDKWLLLDGNEFVRVKFIRCQLAFGATESVTFDSCNFRDCQWTFEGAAQETLDFLAALYHGLGRAGEQLLDDLVESLKTGQIGRAALQRSRQPSLGAAVG